MTHSNASTPDCDSPPIGVIIPSPFEFEHLSTPRNPYEHF
jgi:hypothetical protein